MAIKPNPTLLDRDSARDTIPRHASTETGVLRDSVHEGTWLLGRIVHTTRNGRRRGGRHGFLSGNPIDRSIATCPEGIVEDWDADVRTILRPCFDAIWNAAGFGASGLYDETGAWRGALSWRIVRSDLA